MQQLIKSRENELIKYISLLLKNSSKRKEDGVFVAEGFRLCAEISKSIPPQKVLYTQKALEKYADISKLSGEHYIIEQHVAQKISLTKNSQGVFALFSTPHKTMQDIKERGKYLVLENVQDPVNAGACIRSAAAFGFDGVIILGDGCDVFSDKALRASVGACARVDIIQTQNSQNTLEFLKENNIMVYAATLLGAKPLESIKKQSDKGVALLIGNEGAGLSEKAVECADAAVIIPISNNAESLNAAVAAGIMLYYFSDK